MSTTGHESEAINVQGLKASLKKGGNIGIYNEAICSTAGGTAAKVTNTTPPSFTLTAGAKILVKFTYAISAENATLQVGSNSAKPIYYKGSALPADLVKAGTSLLLAYDGTNFNIVGDINTDTTYSVMGESGASHASGLVPDTPSTAGTTKFLREDGTWQEPAGQNYSAGDGIDISNNEISADNTIARKTDLAPAKLGSGIGTCSTSSGTALEVTLSDYNLVQNGIVAVTFANDVPANSTLNINSKGAKPIYYKGSAITADTIKADDTVMFAYDGTNYVVTSLGGGSGTIVWPEFLNIHLTSTDGDADTGIIGATVLITNTITSETILSTTWQGSDIVLQIDNGVSYTITAGNVSGYAFTPESVSYTAISGYSRTVVMKYMGEAIDLGLTSGNLWCSHNVGATNPEDFGLYFAWGKTAGYPYGTSHSFFNESLDTTASLAYSQDAAYQNTNGKYRMPSRSDYEELISETDRASATINGVPGFKFMNKTNNNIFIFIPKAGYYYNNSYGGAHFEYWTSTGNRVYVNDSFGFASENISNGKPVRAVKM